MRKNAVSLVVAAVAATVAMLAVSIPAAAPQGADPEPDVFRARHVYKGSSVALQRCSGDVCATGLPEPFSVVIPSSMGTVDVTASLTIEYRTTASDQAVVTMRLKSPGTARVTMRPGPFGLRAGPRTTTTLTWTWGNVGASDEPHEFTWSLLAENVVAENPFDIVATEAVLVVEATPAA